MKLKNLKFVPYIVIFILFAMWWFTNESNKNKKETIVVLETKQASNDSTLFFTQEELRLLKQAETKIDTIIIEVSGSVVKEYEKKLNSAVKAAMSCAEIQKHSFISPTKIALVKGSPLNSMFFK